jgi:hypothetical protein
MTDAAVDVVMQGGPSLIHVEDDDLICQAGYQRRDRSMRRMRQVVVARRSTRKADDERPIEPCRQAFEAGVLPAVDGQNSRDRVREFASQLLEFLHVGPADLRSPAHEHDVYD